MIIPAMAASNVIVFMSALCVFINCPEQQPAGGRPWKNE